MSKKLGIIIPVYNEAENIGQTIRAIEANVHTPHAIYIVYDFDEDDTLPVVRKVQEEGVDLVLLKNSAGKVVNAIKKGLKEAKERYLLVTMADLSDDYGVVDRMVSRAEKALMWSAGRDMPKEGNRSGGLSSRKPSLAWRA